MSILRNIFRHKLRAFLTIFGITIGVFALVAMGAMAEKMNLLVDGGVRYYGDKVTVMDKQGIAGFTTTPLSIDSVNDLEKVEGVKRASANVGMTLDEEIGAVNMGPPASIAAFDGRGTDLETFKVDVVKGRKLKKDDRGKVVVGSDLIDKLNAEVGKKVKIRGKQFEVIGITEKTLTTPDTTVEMSLADAQKLYTKSLPKVVKESADYKKLATGFTVYPKEGEDPDDVAKAIEAKYDEFQATGPTAFKEQVADQVKIFTSIIFGIALISLLVGGLSVMNTMTMAIAERTREIGVRKSIGASQGAIIRQFLAESAIIGIIGGLIGLGLGWGFALATNAASVESGTALFLVTPRLAIGSVLFAFSLGILSGLIPAWRAARLNPVDALRYE